MSYAQLTQEERYQIHAYLQMSKTKTEIADFLGRDKSTIGREISRNTGGRGYRPKQAQELANERHRVKNKAIAMKAASF